MNRRDFTFLGAAGTAAALSSRRVEGQEKKIRLGFIGVGNRGDQLLGAFLAQPDVQTTALCDVYEPYLQAAAKKVGGNPKLHRDYRSLIEQKDVDAVVVATPDHWHALPFIEACQASKDVYVEKPLSLTIDEGKRMVAVAQKTGRITQMGVQRRSAPGIQKAVQLMHDGAIGKITYVRCYHIQNEAPMGIGKPGDSEPPTGLDWDLWLGPAPKVPYNRNRCLYKFRWFNDYSGGQLTNFGTHYLDVIQWALKQSAPKSVVSIGGRYAVDDDREIPDVMESVWEYPCGALVVFLQADANSAPGDAKGAEIEFRGTEGTLYVRGGGFEIVPEKLRSREMPALDPTARKANAEQSAARKSAGKAMVVHGRTDEKLHARNFLDSVKSRKPTNCPVEIGYESTLPTLMAKVSLLVGRRLYWDAAAGRFINDPEANRLLAYDYRSPWRLPEA